MEVVEDVIDVDSITSLYTSGMSIRAIVKQYGSDRKTVSKYLRKANIVLRKQPKYTLNEKFFEHINTETKAYWLGFISADGCVRKHINASGGTTYRLVIKLQDKDHTHLQKFLIDIESDTTVKFRYTTAAGRSHRQCYVHIGSKRIVTDLIKLGVVPNKTNTLKFPHIKKSLYKHYWRGFFDGDGWIFKAAAKKYWTMGLVGNKSMILSFRKFLKSIDIKPGKIYNHHSTNGIYTISVTNKSGTVKLSKLFYMKSKVYLDRKHNNALACVSEA